MKKFSIPTPTILAILGAVISVVACISNIRSGTAIMELQDNQWLERTANQKQDRILNEHQQLIILLHEEILRLKAKDTLQVPPKSPTIIHL